MSNRTTLAAVRLAFIIAALTVSASPVRAQNENESIGFQSHHLFEGGVYGENIDILNGAVNLTTPIGPKYQLNQNLGYQLQIAYGSKIWNTGAGDNTAGLIRRGAMGLGGLMHFGRIYRDVAFVNQQYYDSNTATNQTHSDYECTWLYVTPDGNEHVIPGGRYSPDQGPLTCSDYPLDGTKTIDTTYFSVSGTGGMQGWNGTGTAPTLYVTTPDGMRLTFAHFVQAYDGGAFNSAMQTTGADTTSRRYNRDFGGWYVTRIEDTRVASSVWVNIEYDPRVGYEHLISRVTDSAGREILVTNGCAIDSATGRCYEGSYGTGNSAIRPATRVDSILMPKFAGIAGVDNTQRAQYDFTYEWKTITNILDSSASVGANVLRTLTYPTFTKHTGSGVRYTLRFGYSLYGEMTSRMLPTGAVTSYGYNDYVYLGTGLYGSAYDPNSTSRELVSKTLQVNGASYTWQYARQAANATNPMIVVVTDPFGNDTIYYYHASLQNADAQLGFCTEDGWAPEWNDGLNYRIEYYRGSGASRSLVRLETSEHDSDPSTNCATQKHGRNNLRVAKTTTVHIDDGGRQSTVSKSEWDGNGHWKVVSETGSDVAATRTTRTEYLGYDPNRFVYKEVADGKRIVSRMDNTYSGSNVVLSIVRLSLPATGGTAASSQAANGDIVTAYQYDANANVILKEVGSQGGSCAQGTCTATNPKYRIQYGWQGGYLLSKTFYDFVAGRYYPWKSIDRDRDGNTGLVIADRDTAGVPTAYTYDELGRIYDITPQSPEYPTQVEYVDVKNTTLRQGDPAVMGTNWSCQAAAGDFIETCYHYDSMGRVAATEKRPMDPSLGNACQQTQYDGAGSVVYQTEWRYRPAGICTELPQPAVQTCPGNCNASCWAAGLDKVANPGMEYDFSQPDGDPNTGVCDPFGRVLKVTAADGKVTETSYFGTSNKVTVHGIQGTSGPVDAVTTYSRDAWGRLTQVLEPGGGGADAFYTYDIRDNLVQVDLLDKANGGRQTRLFTYDAANRLYSTWNPENGLTDMVGYDPMGNLTEQEDADGNHLLSVYDGAGRMTSLQRKGDWSPSVFTLRQNIYDDASAPYASCQQVGLYGCSAGRLITSRDYDDFGGLLLTETFYYRGMNGRLGALTPQFQNTGALGSLSYLQNNFGQTLRMLYVEGPVSRGGSLGVEYLSANGYLQAVSNFTDSSVYGAVQKYNAAGGIEVLNMLGGVSDRVVPDVRNRPAKLTVGKGTYDPVGDSYSLGNLWKSGAYQYDGAGNISAIGASTYAYDTANRLVQSVDQFFGDTVQRKHLFTYDDYGNMTQDTYSENGVTLQYDQFTVRDQTTGVNNNQIQSHEKDTTDPVTLKTTPTKYFFKTGLTGNLVQSDTLLHEYDTRNRMTGVRQSGLIKKDIARYTYDASGARILKEELSRGTQTYYVRDLEGKPLSEFRRPRGSQTIPEWSKHYIYLGDRLVAMEENTVPTPPGGLRATTATGTVTLTWTANRPEESVTQYTVYRSIYPGSTWYRMGTTSTPTWTETGLVDTTWYQYAVTATGSSESSPGAYLIVQVATTAVPSAPGGLILFGSDGRVDMSWYANPASEQVIGYNVYRNGATTPVNPTLIPGTSFADINLANTTYTYTVKAVNAWGKESAAGNILGVTTRDYARTAPPRDVVASADCSTLQVRVSWTAPYNTTEVLTYLVYRSPDFGAKDVGNTLTYTDASVTVGTVYQYWVVAKDTNGNLSSRSIPVAATPRNISGQVTVPSPPSVTAEDGKVTVRITYPYAAPLTYPMMRIYRRKNIDQDCDSYQLVASVSTPSGNCTYEPPICSLDYVDRSVSNGIPYDYVVTNVDAAERESASSRTALAIPVASPIAYNECVEDLRSTDYADWKDGAGPTASDGDLRRLKVRVEPPGTPRYQPLTATTKGGIQAFLFGYHLYDYYRPYAPGNADSNHLKAIAADFVEGECVVITALSCPQFSCGAGQICDYSLGKCTIGAGVSCNQDSNCQAGQSCVRQQSPHCAIASRAGCWPPDATGGCTIVAVGLNDYCTDTPALAGYCPSDNYKPCISNADCSSGSCYNAHPWDGYLNKYNDGGFNTFTSNFQNDYRIGYGGCLALKAVYQVYVNGKWQSVESAFSDNFNLSPTNRDARCDASTPALYNFALFPGCAAPSDQPPQPMVTPTVSTTAANSVTVSWSPAGVCRPSIRNFCTPGCTPTSSGCPWPLCPTTGDPRTNQICVADPVYQGDGHCVIQSPAACDATHACPTGQTCETGGVDGYYIYATEKRGTGAAAYNPQYHFKPNVPAAKVDKSLTSYTFTNLAPTYGASLPTQFSFRVAAFANGGKFKDPTPPSAFITPATSTATMQAPQSVSVYLGAKGSIVISWLPGADYTNLQTYQVFRSITPGGPYTLLASSLSSYPDTTALPGIDYYYVVKAKGTGGALSDNSPEVSARVLPKTVAPEIALRPPVNFDAKALRYDHPTDWAYIALSWCPNDSTEGVTGYRIYRSNTARGPYTLLTQNQDASATCLDGLHRCEITSPTAGTFAISAPSTACTTGWNSTCTLIDKTVRYPPLSPDYPNQVANYVYYYVVTAVKRDRSNNILFESAYSLENQGWPNYCFSNLSADSCSRYDPDVLPSLPCGLPELSSNRAPASSPAPLAEVDPPAWSSDQTLAPYRTIGGKRGDGNTGPGTLVNSLPYSFATPRKVMFHLDHLGSPRVLTNATGGVISTHNYLPFGQEKPVTATTNTLQFTGHERDKETGIDYMLARYYSSSLGRFMAVDPVQRIRKSMTNPIRWNAYAYSLDNPLKYIDPDGQDVEVATETLPAVKYGLQHSAAFREQYAAAKNDPHLHPRLIETARVGAGNAAESHPSRTIVVDEIFYSGGVETGRRTHIEYSGKLEVPLGIGVKRQAERIAHELYHYNAWSMFGYQETEAGANAEERVANGVDALVRKDFSRHDDDICPVGADFNSFNSGEWGNLSSDYGVAQLIGPQSAAGGKTTVYVDGNYLGN